MMLTKWIEKVGKAVIHDGQTDEEITIVSAKSPMHLTTWIRSFYDPKIHDAALLIRNKKSDYVLFLETPLDVPIKNIIDPNCGKCYLIKYSADKIGKCLIRVD